jgi:hypothetical protein
MGEEQRNLEAAEAGAIEGGRRPTGVGPAGGATRGGLAGPRTAMERSPKTGSGAAAVARRILGGAVAGNGSRNLPAGEVARQGACRHRCRAQRTGGRPGPGIPEPITSLQAGSPSAKTHWGLLKTTMSRGSAARWRYGP